MQSNDEIDKKSLRRRRIQRITEQENRHPGCSTLQPDGREFPLHTGYVIFQNDQADLFFSKSPEPVGDVGSGDQAVSRSFHTTRNVR